MESELVNRLHDLFHIQGYEWRLDDGRVIKPVEADFEEALDKAIEALYDEPVPSQAEFGGLIVRRKADKTFDIYLKIGVHNDDGTH